MQPTSLSFSLAPSRSHRAQVLLDVFQLGFLVEGGIVRLQVADLVQVGMAALLPGIDPYRRFVRVAFDAFLPIRHFFHRGRRLVKGGRIHVHAVRYRLPVFRQRPSSRSLRRILVALDHRFVQLLGRGRLLKIQRFVCLLGNARKVRVGRHRKQRTPIRIPAEPASARASLTSLLLLCFRSNCLFSISGIQPVPAPRSVRQALHPPDTRYVVSVP